MSHHITGPRPIPNDEAPPRLPLGLSDLASLRRLVLTGVNNTPPAIGQRGPSAEKRLRMLGCQLRRIVAMSLVGVALFRIDCVVSAGPNVLFIAVDDLRPELGCYGVDYAQTPNLDAFAKTSVRFTNHFVQVPTCGASRYALLTGRSPASSGVTARNDAFSDGDGALRTTKLSAAQSMPELFRRSGYHTVCVGKISHTPDGRLYQYDGSGDGRDEVPFAWDGLPTPFGQWKRGWGTFFAYANGRHREDGQGHNDLMEFVAENDDELPDGMIANEAVGQLERLSKLSQPFFLGVGFFKPHLPFVAPRQDWDAFADVEVPPPSHPARPTHSTHWHNSGELFRYDFPFKKQRPLPSQRRDQCRKAYLACVRYTDRMIGRVIAALDRLDLTDETIVIIWGDHGWNLGDSQMWAKHTLFERAVHSPLWIRTPQMKTAGQASHALVETTDIYPTLVDLCRPTFSQSQYPLDGTSLRPILNDTDHEVRSNAISYWKSAISIRTERHRLIAERRNGRLSKPELYDCDTEFDPVENLAHRESEIVERLLAEIRRRTAI